jgi:hypothetical protein
LKTRHSLPEYLNQHKLLGRGVEVGICMGEFSTFLLKNWSGKLYMVDSWRYDVGLHHRNNVSDGEQVGRLITTLLSIREFGNRAVIIRETSVDAVKIFQDGFFDFVFIDASHDYKSVKEDLVNWFPKIKIGGVIMGHDYKNLIIENDRRWARIEVGVKQAADEFAREVNLPLKITTEKDNTNEFSFYIEKK